MNIKELLLEKCKEKLLSILQTDGDDFFGDPPEAIYIDYGMGSKRKVGYLLTKVEETYCLTKDGIERVEVAPKSYDKTVSGMYFKQGSAIVGYTKNLDFAFLNFQIGPRYGRGYEYLIIHDGEQMRLGEEIELWIS